VSNASTRADASLDTIIPDSAQKPYDMREVILKIADQVKIRIARSAITQVETPEDAK